MAQMAARSDACSPRASRTRRTARSRTSGENFCFVSLMTPFFSTLAVSDKTGAVHRKGKEASEEDEQQERQRRFAPVITMGDSGDHDAAIRVITMGDMRNAVEVVAAGYVVRTCQAAGSRAT